MSRAGHVGGVQMRTNTLRPGRCRKPLASLGNRARVRGQLGRLLLGRFSPPARPDQSLGLRELPLAAIGGGDRLARASICLDGGTAQLLAQNRRDGRPLGRGHVADVPVTQQRRQIDGLTRQA